MRVKFTMKYRAMKWSAVGCLLALAGCSGGGDDDSTNGGSSGTSTTSGTGGTNPGSGATGGTGATGGAGGSTGGTGAMMGGTGGGTSGTGGGTSGTGATTCGETKITTTAADNYKFHSTLTIDVTKVKPSSELTFSWGGLTTDLLGHPVDLSKVGMVEIGLWNLTLEQFETKLNNDSLAQSDLAIIATILPPTPTTTTGSIYDLTESGEPVDKAEIDKYLDITQFPPENHVYTAMVAYGTALGKDTRMIQGFQLDSSSTNTMVTVTDASTQLELTADLHTLTSPMVPANTPGITIDWNTLQNTAADQPFDPQQITEVRVGKYALSPAEMETKDNFLNLDTIATTMYRANVDAGTSFDLSMTKDDAGNPFPGVDASGTWIVALNCGACANPAPWYMTVLRPCQ